MNALRLSMAALAVSSLLAVGWMVGTVGCGQGELKVYNCAVGTPGETGAEGEPDPCHCDNPGGAACACTDPNEFQNSGLSGQRLYQLCLQSLADAGDAGEGGPLSGCTGQCWPPPPHDWASPLLLWFGPESEVPPCPLAAPWVYYNGYADSTFALACTGDMSGACPVAGEVCAPTFVDGFSQCVIRDGDVPCPILGPYTEEHVFYAVAGQSILPSTFCCFPSPLPTP
jgi:hypothetical protein